MLTALRVLALIYFGIPLVFFVLGLAVSWAMTVLADRIDRPMLTAPRIDRDVDVAEYCVMCAMAGHASCTD